MLRQYLIPGTIPGDSFAELPCIVERFRILAVRMTVDCPNADDTPILRVTWAKAAIVFNAMAPTVPAGDTADVTFAPNLQHALSTGWKNAPAPEWMLDSRHMVSLHLATGDPLHSMSNVSFLIDEFPGRE